MTRLSEALHGARRPHAERRGLAAALVLLPGELLPLGLHLGRHVAVDVVEHVAGRAARIRASARSTACAHLRVDLRLDPGVEGVVDEPFASR